MPRIAFPKAEESGAKRLVVNEVMLGRSLARERGGQVAGKEESEVDSSIVELLACNEGALEESWLHLCHSDGILRKGGAAGIEERTAHTVGRAADIDRESLLGRNRRAEQGSRHFVHLHLVGTGDGEEDERRVSIVPPKEIRSGMPLLRIVDEVLRKTLQLLRGDGPAIGSRLLCRRNDVGA